MIFLYFQIYAIITINKRNIIFPFIFFMSSQSFSEMTCQMNLRMLSDDVRNIAFTRVDDF